MVVFRGNFIRGTSFELQRFVLIPWAKKKNFIIYSKGKDYCSSVPVRYIPKKSSKTEEEFNLTSQPEKACEDKHVLNKSELNAFTTELSNGGKSSRRSFDLDDTPRNKFQSKTPSNSLIINHKSGFYEKLSGVEAEIDDKFGVEDGKFMEEPQIEMHQEDKDLKKIAVRVNKTKQDVELMAVEFLAKRAFTAVELKKKLIGKRCPHEIVDAVIMDFKSRGLINDLCYAETFSQSRWSSSSWGPRRIKQSLFAKGVSKEVAEKAIQLVFEESEEEDSRLGMSKQSIDHLYVQASKQWMRGRGVPNDKQKSRITRWLQYRGFNWGVISYIVKKLESEYPP